MPSFEDILQQTLIVLGAKGAGIDPFGSDRFSTAPRPRAVELDPSTAAYKFDEENVLNNRVWTWQFDGSALHRIEKLAVLDRHMNYRMSMTVCDAVVFGTEDGGKQVFFADFEDGSSGAKPRVALPLTKDFLLAQLFVEGGRNPGYEPEKASVKLRRARVVVCVSLVCCKERADFEPGGILGMARFYPHVMAMANVPLTQFEARIRLERPFYSPHTDDMVKVGSRTPIENILVADTNQKHFAEGHAPGPPLPTWDDQFDYYEVDDTPKFFGKELRVVSAISTEREKAGLVKRHNIAGTGSEMVHKMPRQGAFDSIHVAPRMAAPTAGPFAPVKIDPKFGSWKFDKIAMAPFCFHDCMHTHSSTRPRASPTPRPCRAPSRRAERARRRRCRWGRGNSSTPTARPMPSPSGPPPSPRSPGGSPSDRSTPSATCR